jgi:glyoxylase-like metal-dependent hydrolase (beta-lactamase superfamily II)
LFSADACHGLSPGDDDLKPAPTTRQLDASIGDDLKLCDATAADVAVVDGHGPHAGAQAQLRRGTLDLPGIRGVNELDEASEAARLAQGDGDRLALRKALVPQRSDVR